LLEETAYHPSGVPRHEHRLKLIEEKYTFTGKERDRESKLHYFEARYLTAALSRFASPDFKYASPDSFSPSDLASFLAHPQELNLYTYAFNNPLRYNDPSGLDGKEAFGWGNDAAGIMAGAAEEAALLQSKTTPLFPLMSSGTGKVVGALGKGTAVISVGIKAYEFARDRSEANGAQLLNEGAKTLVGIACAPVGLIWSVADLAGVGPSAILESTYKSIEAHKEAKAHYEKATAAYQGMTKMINQKAPRIAAQQQYAAQRLKVLQDKTAKWNAKSKASLKGETRSLAQLNSAIKAQERANARTAAQLRRELSKLRKAQGK
jgi:RHS repeat-associated protein